MAKVVLPLSIVALFAIGAVAWIVIGGDEDSKRGASGDGSPAPPGFVHREGARLYLDGEPYRFVGLNIPWANYRHETGCGVIVDEETLERTLERISGSVDAVRMWFFQAHATVSGVRDWTVFDQTLRAIADRGMKVIVTLTDQQGSCGDPPGGLKNVDWYESGYATQLSPGFPQTYRDYVRDVVTRYADRPEILAWQLINEASVLNPDGGCPDQAAAAQVLRAFADDVAGMIRSIDRHHLISLGSGLQGSCGITVTADPAANDYRYVHAGPMIDFCEYHDYNVPTTALFELQRWEMDTCGDLGKPFFVGEIGIEAADRNRPALVAAKLDAQFGYAPAPSQGALLWQLGDPEVGVCDKYCIEGGDPLLDVLAGY